MATTLSNEEILRYSRHLILPEVGKPGQEKLKAAKVMLIGSGGLGSPNALYLAAAGIGTIGIIDFDVVDHTNLQRQLLFGTESVGLPKVEGAKRRIQSINPNTIVNTYNEKLSSENVMRIFKDYDLIIDGTDNFPTRYLVNDACVFLGKTNIYGSIFRFEGQATVFKPKVGPCYRCLYPEPPPPGEVPSCAEGGVLGILPGLVGMIQASEAVKYFLGKGESLVGRLLQISVLDMTFRELKIQRDPDCPVCGDNPTIKELVDYEQFCGLGIGLEAPEIQTGMVPEITPQELKKLIDSNGKKVNIIDVREPYEHEISKIDGSKLIPLGQIMDRVNELDSSLEYIVICRSGSRSAKAIQQLQKIGFKKLRNLRGGINAWADIDPTVAKY
ncbi:MAG: putative adenylyltransferase/sulfurtransferase MoeZ [Elusimicrobia bacterium]|nr:putative adenylyltransferase/sulfurtransferase MoeZ [Elusimicrobiota bacterium]